MTIEEVLKKDGEDVRLTNGKKMMIWSPTTKCWEVYNSYRGKPKLIDYSEDVSIALNLLMKD